MGKKSRRKGGARTRPESKAGRRERLRERREHDDNDRAEEEIAEAAASFENDDRGLGRNSDDAPPRAYFRGDRVWFDSRLSDGSNPDTYRGIVDGVNEDGTLDVVPLRAKIEHGYDDDASWNIHAASVVPDFENMTLRFDVGDKVLCRGDKGWVPSEVDFRWPIYETVNLPLTADDRIPAYKCGRLAAPCDRDDCIMKHPTDFRFGVGDDVTFDPKKAFSIGGTAKNLEDANSWRRGTITAVDITGKRDGYFVYECSFDFEGKLCACHIDRDVDECIAKSDAEPRERLTEAIQQDCTREHLEFLATLYSIDVTTFRDMVIETAIQNASYNALLWLQEDYDVNLFEIRDDEGNNLLHRIAKSRHAARFIRELDRRRCYPTLDVNFSPQGHHSSMSNEFNNEGDSWLSIIVKRGDTRALDAALSRRGNLASDLTRSFMFGDDQFASLEDCILEAGNTSVRFIFDAFRHFRRMNKLYDCINGVRRKDTEGYMLAKDEMAPFLGDGADRHARQFVRFARDWKSSDPRNKIYCSIVKKGYFTLFELLYNVNQTWFWNEKHWIHPNEDGYEYTQPSIPKREDDQNGESLADLVTICFAGETSKYKFSAENSSKKKYFDIIRRRLPHIRCQHLSLLDLLKERAEKNEYLIKHKISCLEDDPSLGGRLKILSRVLKDAPGLRLDVLMAIRFRQCGIMRWMVETKMVDLNADASKVENLCKDFLFTRNKHIPSIQLGWFLCFAAVEYDDLYSLQWLCQIQGRPNISCCGLNLLHLACLLGRLEIIVWLSSTPIWNALAEESCAYDPFEETLAVHIAAGQGHIKVAELLVQLDCSEHDEKGRLPENFAKMAPCVKIPQLATCDYAYARAWANEKEKEREMPKCLENNIKELFDLLAKGGPTDHLKAHIKTSKCLCIDSWIEYGCGDYEKLGPMGVSYGEVVDKCLKYQDVDFAEWLCLRLNISYDEDWEYEEFWKEPQGMFMERTNKSELHQHDLLLRAKENGDTKLADILSRQFVQEIVSVDPARLNFFSSLPSLGTSHLSSRLQSKFLCVKTCITIGESIWLYDLPAICINCGGTSDEVIELIGTYESVRNELDGLSCFNSDLLECCQGLKRIAENKLLQMDTTLFGFDCKNYPLHKLTSYPDRHAHSELIEFYAVVAVQGYSDLVEFSLTHLQGWTEDIELKIVHIASYLGHSTIVDIFLSKSEHSFLSDVGKRHFSALMGAAEAGRYHDIEQLIMESRDFLPKDPVKGRVITATSESMTKRELAKYLAERSVVTATVCGYVGGSFPEPHPILFLVKDLQYTHEEVLYAMELALVLCRYYDDEAECIVRFVNIFKFVLNEFDIEPFHHERQIQELATELFHFISYRSMRKELPENFLSVIVEWLESLVKYVDIQQLEVSYDQDEEHKSFYDEVRHLKQSQLQYWRQFPGPTSPSLSEIQQSIDCGALPINGRYRGGYLLTHLAAAYDRVDLLEWLAKVKGMDLMSIDGKGRTCQEVAKAGKAMLAHSWINEFNAGKVISRFITHNYQRLRSIQKHQRMLRMSIIIQTTIRGFLTRRIHRGALVIRLEESQRFNAIWAQPIQSLKKSCKSSGFNWSAVRAKISDISRAEIFGIDEVLTGAAVESTKENDPIDHCVLMEDDKKLIGSSLTSNLKDTSDGCLSGKGWPDVFQVTSHVVKFLRQGDPKYRSFFVRRMKQLANGDRSRILQKRVKGSNTIIYESYLEQRSGFRILWTEEGETIVIWFVTKHKSVSRLIKLIDDSKNRSARQMIPQSVLSELDGDIPFASTRKEVLLDIVNVPLKLYDLTTSSIGDVEKSSWSPSMHLTEEELDVVEATGSTLLLGRSGTGKTVCICNRIEMDRQKYGIDPSFSQLFVSRSKRLCSYVQDIAGVGTKTNQRFLTSQELIHWLESILPQMESARCFAPSQRVGFHRFQREFYHGKRSTKGRPSSLVVWKTIRTFLKGSIEAFKSPGRILQREYFVTGKLGKNRCRLNADNLSYVYDTFLEYQSFIQAQSLWDDCDRVVSLLARLERSKIAAPSTYDQVRKNKVYVDECQDYAQIEILLFFYLGGPGGLFFAGDPAQSVVVGTDFRFEDLRSVGYFVAGNDRRGLIPSKPKTVNVNFRSHSGILKTAAAILEYLFSYFPQSAKQLQKDQGLFQGPRPGVCHNVSHKQLAALLRGKLKGVVVLTHDDSALRWKRTLDYPLVYGIRETKGLEFKSVIILAFFAELPMELQRPWRNLVLNREDLTFEARYPLVETMLKLLYTAVTRSIEQLYFVETTASLAGDATIRWLTTTSSVTKEDRMHEGALATASDVNSLKSMSMTCDEWVSAGIENAEMVEADDVDLDNALSLIDRSVYCFEQAQHAKLTAKARIHRSSVQFRSSLFGTVETSLTENELAIAETRASQLVESLLIENLHTEALHLVQSITQLLSPYTSNELEKQLIAKLQVE